MSPFVVMRANPPGRFEPFRVAVFTEVRRLELAQHISAQYFPWVGSRCSFDQPVEQPGPHGYFGQPVMWRTSVGSIGVMAGMSCRISLLRPDCPAVARQNLISRSNPGRRAIGRIACSS